MGEPRLQAYLNEVLVSCSLCNGDLNDPRTLECLHAFCCACLEGYIEENKDADDM